MSTQEYLESVLESQRVANGSNEMKELRRHRKSVESLIESGFPDSSPTVRYGGSKAKGTMNRESYDLDIICYFPHEDSEPGESLREIYQSVKEALQDDYSIEEKRSSLRLRGKTQSDYNVDFHVDVVPGRYVDDSKTDTYLHQTSGDKRWLQTNLDAHIDYIRDSEVRDAIRLIKLWNVRNGIGLKTFVLELAVVKLLKGKKGKSLEDQLVHVWKSFTDSADELSVEDPANSRNDLTPMLDSARTQLSVVGGTTLNLIEAQGWEAVFGELPDSADGGGGKAEKLQRAAAVVGSRTKPWSVA